MYILHLYILYLFPLCFYVSCAFVCLWTLLPELKLMVLSFICCCC